MTRILLSALFVLATPALSRGQQGVPSSETCSRLIDAAQRADTSAVVTGDLQRCGPSGRMALSGLIRSAAKWSDRRVLAKLAAASTVSDAALLSAASDLAENPAAGRSARVTALEIMIAQVFGARAGLSIHDPTFSKSIDPSEFVVESRNCTIAAGGGFSRSDEQGLITSKPVLVRTSADIARQPNVDPVVRNVARCIETVLGGRPEEQLQPANVHLEAFCSVFMLVRTDSPKRVTLEWSVVATPRTGFVSVDSGRTAEFGVDRLGTVVISYQGRKLAEARTSGVACK